MCSSVDLPAPEGAISATDWPGHTASSAPLEDVERRVALPVVALDAVQEDDGRFAVGHRALLVTQRVDRIEARRAPGRIERGEQRQRERQHDHRRGLAESHLGRQLRQEVDFLARRSRCWSDHDRNWRIDSTLRHTSVPTTKPISVPTTPIEAPVMTKMRMIAPWVAPMVRMMAMSGLLSFTSMIRPGHDVERRDQHDQRQDQEHHVALDLQRGEEGARCAAASRP